jgi:uncharacterized protein (DUF58 family)
MKRITNWLETRACAPSYGGWVLVGIAICFFGAAINTMAGWLYVISGVSVAMLVIAAFLPPRSLAALTISRRYIEPVTAGDDLTVELQILNQAKKSVNLLQVEDILPFVLGKPIKKPVEAIAPGETYQWVYYYPTQRRGVYRWHNVELGSGAPLGLFWCRRQHDCAATAFVYPMVLPLSHCPLVDNIGQEDCIQGDPLGKPLQAANEGIIRSLRPYRNGDPMRMIHWRTSARYGEFRVRELELLTAGQDIIIALDSATQWEEENFEDAVIAAASLYFYAQKQQMQVQLWTAATGLIRGKRAVLETLAATRTTEDPSTKVPENYPMIWLTESPATLNNLPQGSRWVLWQTAVHQKQVVNKNNLGVVIDKEQSLQLQLQKTLSIS